MSRSSSFLNSHDSKEVPPMNSSASDNDLYDVSLLPPNQSFIQYFHLSLLSYLIINVKLLRIDTEHEKAPWKAILEVSENEDSFIVTKLKKILRPENWKKKGKDNHLINLLQGVCYNNGDEELLDASFKVKVSLETVKRAFQHANSKESSNESDVTLIVLKKIISLLIIYYLNDKKGQGSKIADYRHKNLREIRNIIFKQEITSIDKLLEELDKLKIKNPLKRNLFITLFDPIKKISKITTEIGGFLHKLPLYGLINLIDKLIQLVPTENDLKPQIKQATSGDVKSNYSNPKKVSESIVTLSDFAEMDKKNDDSFNNYCKYLMLVVYFYAIGKIERKSYVRDDRWKQGDNIIYIFIQHFLKGSIYTLKQAIEIQLKLETDYDDPKKSIGFFEKTARRFHGNEFPEKMKKALENGENSEIQELVSSIVINPEALRLFFERVYQENIQYQHKSVDKKPALADRAIIFKRYLFFKIYELLIKLLVDKDKIIPNEIKEYLLGLIKTIENNSPRSIPNIIDDVKSLNENFIKTVSAKHETDLKKMKSDLKKMIDDKI